MSKSLVTGHPSEYLSATAGKVGKMPVGIITLRPNRRTFSSVNIMLDRPTMERMVEDFTFLLEHSPTLAEGAHHTASLTEFERLAKPKPEKS